MPRVPGFPFPGKGIGDYLQLTGLSASCGDDDAVGLFRADTFEEARAACDAKPSCDFFSWSRGDRAATLCSGGAARFKEHPSSAVGVHPRMLELSRYASLPNYQAVCEPEQVLAEVQGVKSVAEAARMCDGRPDCHYFALSTVKDKWSRLEPRETPFYPANTLWLCGGEPVFRRRMGWVSAGKLRNMPPLPPTPDPHPDVAATGADSLWPPVQKRYPRSPAQRPPRSPGDFIFSEPLRPKFEDLYEPVPSAARRRKEATRELLGNLSKVRF